MRTICERLIKEGAGLWHFLFRSEDFI